MRAHPFTLARDERGATLVEFAIVAPVMLLTLMGLYDISYHEYMQSVLTGAVQRSGRDSALEGSDPATLDAKVMTQVNAVARNATGVATRTAFTNYVQVAPEPFTDSNGNGVYDPGECYSDTNNNNQWDANPGAVGQGNAGDATVYTMTVTYPRLFPLAGFMGGSSMQTISSTTILKNQPFAAQNAPTPVTRC